jgi:hypothetical protein
MVILLSLGDATTQRFSLPICCYTIEKRQLENGERWRYSKPWLGIPMTVLLKLQISSLKIWISFYHCVTTFMMEEFTLRNSKKSSVELGMPVSLR